MEPFDFTEGVARMTVILRCSYDTDGFETYDHWFSVTGTKANLPAGTRLPQLAERLEAAFDAVRDVWWSLGKDMGRDHGSARWSHTAAAGSYGSDFGLMLAWERLILECAAKQDIVLVVCDDPWLFRHLETFPNVSPGRRPRVWLNLIKGAIRGFAARLSVAFRVAMAAWALREDRNKPAGRLTSAILVYGHPSSNADGVDAYFGSLLNAIPGLARLIHTDCPVDLALKLGATGNTASLHAWGHCGFALWRLPFCAWRPSRNLVQGSHGWLVRRAAARENSGGGPAMNCWQMHCQRRWLAECNPNVVAWPWENHAWERDFVRAASVQGIKTVGYQHAVVGRHQFNFSPASNPDGLNSIPDRVACNGPGYRDQIIGLGIPKDQTEIVGSFRVGPIEGSRFDPNGPIYVAFSAIPMVAERMMSAIRPLAEKGRRFVIKDHPMYPFRFEETETLRRIDTTIPETQGISAVLYTTGTPGLEGLFAGVPTFRLMLEDSVALDIMPNGVAAHAVTAETLSDGLDRFHDTTSLAWETIMAAVDIEAWRALLLADDQLTLEHSFANEVRRAQ